MYVYIWRTPNNCVTGFTGAHAITMHTTGGCHVYRSDCAFLGRTVNAKLFYSSVCVTLVCDVLPVQGPHASQDA